MKAGISVDPRIVSLLGRKLYTRNPVEIAIREMLQNSVDACKKAGVIPRITCKLEYFSETNTAKITFTDNGCGMTEDVLVNYFLRYGSSTKAGSENETGRFGVGVGIVLCGNYWKVRTLDNEVTSDDALAGAEIRKHKDTLKGTEIFVVYQDVNSWQFWPEALEYVAFSDVDVHFIYIHDESRQYDNLHVGLTQEKVELTSMPTWIGYGIESFDDKVYNFSGRVMVRLNGLVQHRRYTGGNRLEGNLIVDLDSHLEPDDKDFPMVMSREKLCGDTEVQVEDWVQTKTRNSLTTDTMIKRSLETPHIKFVRGKILIGTRSRDGFLEERLDDFQKKDEQRTEAIKEWLRASGNSYRAEDTELKPYIDNHMKFPIMRLHNYEPSPDDVDRDAKFINAWAAVLELVMLEGTNFGVGLSSEDGLYSELNEVEGIYFFTINPAMFPEQPTAQGQILSIWVKACHEAAHITCSGDHGEIFQSTVEYIQMATGHIIYKMMGRLAAILY